MHLGVFFCKFVFRVRREGFYRRFGASGLNCLRAQLLARSDFKKEWRRLWEGRSEVCLVLTILSNRS